MKRLLVILTALVGIITMQAQNADFAKQVADYNKSCPKTISEGLTMSSVDMSDNALRFNYTVDDGAFDGLQEMKDILRESFVADLVSSSEPVTKNVVALCSRNGVNIKQRFATPTGREFTLEILASELK